MSCKSIFVNLGGGGGVSVNTGVLQIAGGVALDSTLRFVEDQNGTDSPLKLSTTEVRIDSGVTNRRLTFGSNGQMSFVNDNDFIIDYSTGSANIFRLAYSGTSVRLNSDGYQFANYASGTIYANLQGEGLAIGQGTTTASARLHVRGDGTNPIQKWQNGAGTDLATFTNAGLLSFFSTGQGIDFYGQGVKFLDSIGTIDYSNAGGSTSAYHKFRSPSSPTTGNQKVIGIESNFGAAAGSATFRPLSLEYTINNSGAQTGTATGIFLNATETALNGMGHDLMDLQVGGSSVFKVSNAGLLTLSSSIFCAGAVRVAAGNSFYWNGRSTINSPSDGVITLTDSVAANFNRLQFGGTTASFPSIKRSGINIEVRLADDTGYGGITAGRSTEKTLEVLEVSGAMGLGFFNTPAINQPTVAIGEATYISNGGGAIHIDDTIGGYTMQQVVQALQNLGLLA
jgi:hypothetical protein